ncbi:hypothetical protein [Streptomyces graminilatus]|uniref:hypothetical protein n=1 Tax=Streptomyces graminilatus TaxID=1464070 RepID=UPI0006E1F0C4|nr:hypothetical protein [Streptomyces graminilatus]
MRKATAGTVPAEATTSAEVTTAAEVITAAELTTPAEATAAVEGVTSARPEAARWAPVVLVGADARGLLSRVARAPRETRSAA